MTASTGAISRVTAGRRPTLSVRPQWRRPIPVAGGLLLLAALTWLVISRRGPARPSGTGMDVRRVAVLYFQDQSPDSSLGYLAAGLTEGLIHQLAEVRSLDVVSRNGVLPYRNVDLPRDSIARALGAGTRSTEAWTRVQQAEAIRKDGESLAQAGKMDSAMALFARTDSTLASAERADPTWIDPILLRGQLVEPRVRLTRNPALLEQGLAHTAPALAIAPEDPGAIELRGTLRYRRWQLARPPNPQQAAALLDDARTDLDRATNLSPTLASA